MRQVPVTFKIPSHLYVEAQRYRDALADLEQAVSALKSEYEEKILKLQQHYGGVMNDSFSNVVRHFGYDPADQTYSIVMDMNYMAQHGKAYIQVYRATPVTADPATKPTGTVH